MSIRRMRDTINSYVAKLSECGWHRDFQVGTVQALERRLAAHADKIMGKHHLEVQAAYIQLKQLAPALLRAHKSLRAWTDSRCYEYFVGYGDSLVVLQEYMLRRNIGIASDGRLLQLHAEFFTLYNKHKVVSRALEGACVSEWLKAVAAHQSKEPVPASPKGEVQAEDSNEPVKSAPKARGQRTRYMQVLVNEPIDFSCTAVQHLEFCMPECIK